MLSVIILRKKVVAFQPQRDKRIGEIEESNPPK